MVQARALTSARVVGIVWLVLSVLYSARLKNTTLLGNLTVPMFSYGSSSGSSPWGRELTGTIAIFFYTLGNELYKTAVNAPEGA